MEIKTHTYTIKGRAVKVYHSDPESGTVKHVYPSVDGQFAVAVFFEADGRPSTNTGDDRRRLENLESKAKRVTDDMRKRLCWPIAFSETRKHELAFLMPMIPKNFFCSFRLKNGKKRTEKVIEEFLNPVLANAFFYKFPQGASFYNHLAVCREIAGAVHDLHSLGIIHTDLSSNNVLIDPFNKQAYIIDIDGSALNNGNLKLVDVKTLGTPLFTAPEILQKAKERKPIRFDMSADLFPLAVHIYSILLHRHPLARFLTDAENTEFGKMIVEGTIEEEEVVFRIRPTYIESDGIKKFLFSHETYDASFRQCEKKFGVPEKELKNPNWLDVDKFSSERICGPYLSELFRTAFIDGNAHPEKRPSADQWERAISKTINLLYPCTCKHQAFVLTEKNGVRCPFCGARVIQPIPVLYIYYFDSGRKKFSDRESVIVGYGGRKIFEEQFKGDPISKNSTPVFELLRTERGYRIRNLHLPDMRIVGEHSAALNRVLKQGESHELLDGTIFRLMTNGNFETIMISRFVNQS